MSQYFTYENLKGTVPMDIITADPNCKTCGVPKCYNKFESVQGVSKDKHSYILSPVLDSTNLPMEPIAYDPYMVTAPGADISKSNPYSIITTSTGTCDLYAPKYYQINVPAFPISLDKTRVKSSHSRVMSHNQKDNSSYHGGVMTPAYNEDRGSIEPTLTTRPFSYRSGEDEIIPSSFHEKGYEEDSVHQHRYQKYPFMHYINKDYLKDESITRPSKSVSKLSRSVADMMESRPKSIIPIKSDKIKAIIKKSLIKQGAEPKIASTIASKAIDVKKIIEKELVKQGISPKTASSIAISKATDLKEVIKTELKKEGRDSKSASTIAKPIVAEIKKAVIAKPSISVSVPKPSISVSVPRPSISKPSISVSPKSSDSINSKLSTDSKIPVVKKIY